MNESVVKIANMNKRYDHTLALNDVSVTLERGRIYGFIGQNGAGKTTLLRIITGLAFPSAGQLLKAASIGVGTSFLFFVLAYTLFYRTELK